ncbi:hypothetical protein H4R33_005091 [Dimargaris cristalligena]|uniref:Uncharacterized protein n=1 Tax=Dimargaris cristalligena TaxID=215637 RepID=A0A4P9ZVE7_9FUNG|nr:hypothetical protein H4R33_005091 [Dimargaris cristalligena]RKP36812.1 hypothetical protein BJ085DRAFT_37338 [Dimargaris cristalligena]|eukprot:RKP36812.1 hypothetical protein BJ085DRAFT_37338 [Dimargaris cristalligena]
MRTVLWCTLLVALIGLLTGVQSRATTANNIDAAEQAAHDKMVAEALAQAEASVTYQAHKARKYLNARHRLERGLSINDIGRFNDYYYGVHGINEYEEQRGPEEAQAAIQKMLATHPKQQYPYMWTHEKRRAWLAYGTDKIARKMRAYAAPSTPTAPTSPGTNGSIPSEGKKQPS